LPLRSATFWRPNDHRTHVPDLLSCWGWPCMGYAPVKLAFGDNFANFGIDEIMNKHDYLKMLEDGHAETDSFQGGDRTSRLEYLSDQIFNFTTYESEMGELFASKAVEVCAAISDKKTFDFIGVGDENRMWYLLMCNMPFFADRLEWGTSIRGAWWGASTGKPITLDTCGLYWQGAQITETMKFTADEWAEFIAAMREFSA